MLTHEQKIQAIKELYDELPTLTDCKGLCSVGCTDIDMSETERDQIKRRHQLKIRTRSNVEINRHGPKRCKALKKNGACGVYEDRPLICRAWGVIDPAPCPFGCKPDRYLTDEEYKRLELKIESIGGHWYRSEADRKGYMAWLSTPTGKLALKKQMDAARAEVARMREQIPHITAAVDEERSDDADTDRTNV